MFHRIFRSQEKIKFAIFSLSLSLVAILIFLTPLLLNYKGSAFFTIDPDVVYLVNSLSFLRTRFIGYFDHPGTPAIMLNSLFLSPLAIYIKLNNYGFLNWTLVNFEAVAIYSRIVSSIITFFGLSIIIYSITDFSKKFMIGFLTFLAILTFGPIYFSGIVISAESTSILITGLWIFLYSKILQTEKNKHYYFLAIVSGIAIANRLTAILLPTLVPFVILTSQKKFNEKILLWIKTSFLIILSFFVGIIPVLKWVGSLFNWFFNLANSTDVHGGGESALLNREVILKNLNTILENNYYKYLFLIIFLVLGFLLYSLVIKKRKTAFTLIQLLSISALVTFSFFKYPLFHYQITNFLIIVFLISVTLSNINKYLLIIFVLILIQPFVKTSRDYSSSIIKAKTESFLVDKFNQKNRSNKAEIWHWARSHKFSLIWARDYSGIYHEDLIKEYPNLYSLQSSMEIKNSLASYNLFDICWDQLYIQTELVNSFLKENETKKFEIVNIPGVTSVVMLRPSFELEKCSESHSKK